MLASGGGSGDVVADDACAPTPGSSAPVRMQECSAGPCGCRNVLDCASRGAHFVCGGDGECVCEDGWSGSDCSVVLLQPVGTTCSSTAVVDVNGTCCDSAIDSVTGVCCGSGGVVDGNGRCCSGTVDACGVCGGDGVVMDVSGVCCSHALAPSGLCCDGSLDSCGVCDGTNDCDALLSLSLPAGLNVSAADIAATIGVPIGTVVIVSTSTSGGGSGSTVRVLCSRLIMSKQS